MLQEANQQRLFGSGQVKFPMEVHILDDYDKKSLTS